MSDTAKHARKAMRDKIARLVKTDPRAKVDASGYTPPDELAADIKTGARPLSRRLYKRGGKVIMVSGESEKKHAGRKPRKSGGKALTADSLVNRNVREANEEREGKKHVGGFKRGGTAHDDVAEDKKLIKSMVKHEAIKPGKSHGGSCRCSKCMGGRTGKAGGGYADGGKTKWIQKAIKHPGSLHKALHVAEGEKIPEKKLAKATHSKNPHVARKARLAETLKGFHKADGGPTSCTPDTPMPKEPPMRVVKLPTLSPVPPGPSEGDLNDLRAAQAVAKARGMKFVNKKRGGSASVADGKLEGTRPTGGRLARKAGGRAKGKFNVNVIINPHGQHPAGGAGPAGMPADGSPVGLRQGIPPMGSPPGAAAPPGMPPAGPPGAPPGMMPPGGPPVMGRRSGGRVSYPIKDGAGGGLGRLQKIKAYGDEAYDAES